MGTTPMVEIDGTSMGPFELVRAERSPFGSSDSWSCILRDIVVTVSQPPAGFRWRERDPSPLKDRCDELGGCEFSRLMRCPQVMGYLKPIDKSCFREKKIDDSGSAEAEPVVADE